MKTLNSLKTLSPVAVTALLFLTDPALAAAGTKSVHTLFDTILSTLQDLSVPIVTIGIILSALAAIFTQWSIRLIAGPFIGAVVLAAAPWLAELLVG